MLAGLQYQIFPADFTWPAHLAFNEGTQTSINTRLFLQEFVFLSPKQSFHCLTLLSGWFPLCKIIISEAKIVIIFCPLYAALRSQYHSSHIMSESEVWGERGDSRKKLPGSQFVSLSHTCPLSSARLSISVFSILTRVDIFCILSHLSAGTGGNW